VREDDVLVHDFKLALASKWGVGTLEFYNKCVLVKDLILPSAKLAMYFHAVSDELEHFFFVKQFTHGFGQQFAAIREIRAQPVSFFQQGELQRVLQGFE
jgi:hypothetical protein